MLTGGAGMKLSDLLVFSSVAIQCHDNPDADSIASGFAVYEYFKDHGKEVRLFYSGRNLVQKTNLILLIDKLNVPIEHLDKDTALEEDLLLTVDCQYGAGNVSHLDASNIAMIDHHQPEISGCTLCEIQPIYGSCSTLVWRMLLQEKYPVNDNQILGTALYYGLYTDTNQFSELSFPMDQDMREKLSYNKNLITIFRNSNLNLKELEIAGIALIRNIYNEEYRYSIIKAQPCDPNILGLISDFLLQVDGVDVCVVYHESEAGLKLSIRSCVKEVRASELADYLTANMGSGGGHIEKAGGFINGKLYQKYYPTLHSEGYISKRMNEYYDQVEIIEAKSYQADLSDMGLYQKKKMIVWYVDISKLLPVNTPITVRTLEGDIDLVVEESIYIMIGIKGEVYPIKKDTFEKRYQKVEEYEEIVTDYRPIIKNRESGMDIDLVAHANCCVASGKTFIYAKQLGQTLKIFTLWDEEKYMLGKPGDYFAVSKENLQDMYIVEQNIFYKTYEKIDLNIE